MTDINLDASSATTRREMLIEAWAKLDVVVRYSLDLKFRPDENDCNRIRRARDLLHAVLIEKEPT